MRGLDKRLARSRGRRGVLAGLIGCTLLIGAAVSAATVMYRFENADGTPVYSYTLPADQARYGYQKIDPETGRLLESVAPQLPPDELAARLQREQAQRDCRDELTRIYQLYGSEADIDRALENALESLDTRISQLDANLRQARREQGRLRTQAADAERSGREIPRAVLDNIARSRSQIDTLEREIAQRHEEQNVAHARYARDLARFRDGTCPEPGAVAGAET